MTRRLLLAAALLVVAAAVYFVAPIGREIYMMCSDDPTIWEDAIRAFEEADDRAPPPDGAVLFVGSSTIRLWETLRDDMAPLQVIRRGFGGAKVNDVLFYSDRIIAKYRPAAVVLFIGSNDVSGQFCNEASSPDRVVELTRDLIAKIHADLPRTPIYYLAIKPSYSNANVLAGVAAVNAAIRDAANTDAQLIFIDANDAIVGADGRVRQELLERDGLHLNRQGYVLWAPAIRERLLKDFSMTGGDDESA